MLGLILRQVAELIGVTYQQAYKYERGANRISADRLHQPARTLGVEPGRPFEGLGAHGPAEPSPHQRQMLELARSFDALPRRQREALCALARALAGAEPGPEEGAGREAA